MAKYFYGGNFMKKMIFAAAIALFAISGFAVLPPFYQSSKEIKRILNDQQTHEKLGSGQQILDIKKVEGGWVITTTRFELFVDVIYLPPKQPGPAEFELEFHDPVEICVNS